MNFTNHERQLAATLYPLVGLEGIRYRFRVLRVRERVPNDNMRPRRIQKWADRLWRKELRCPVYSTNRFDSPAFLIPEWNSPPGGSSIEISDVPDKVYHIDTTDQTIEILIEEAIDTERELVCRMIERPFTEQFRNLVHKYWQSEWTLYVRQKPENEENAHDMVNAFRGLKFGVVYLQGIGLHFAADVRTKFVGKKSLQYCAQDERAGVLEQHLDLELPVDKRAYFVRDNGSVKLPCHYAGETGLTIGKCTYDESGETVFKYYQRRYGNVAVDSDDLAVFVQDRRDGRSIPVPASRLFPVFTTDYEGLRDCSVRSQMTPTERTAIIQTFIADLSGAKYESRPISIQNGHLVRKRTVFAPPRLEYGQENKLEAFNEGSVPDASSGLFDSLTVKWLSAKLTALYKYRPFHNEPLPDLVVLYPTTIDRQTRDAFLGAIEAEVKRLTEIQLRVVHQYPYEVGPSERMGSSLLRLAAHVRAQEPRSLAVVILWDRFTRSVHRELKESLKSVQSQCVTEKVAKNIAKQINAQRAMSQTRNLALAILTEAGTKPWVLADKLHHDLYLGIDLLYGRIGYHFLYGQGGRNVTREFGEAIVRGKMKEAIKTPDLQRRVEKSLRSIHQDGYPITSFVIHRDGRWWPSESAGLQNAISSLKSAGVLPPDVRCAVVEIHKNHMPVRLFTSVEDNRSELLRNPLPGTYLNLDSQRALLSTTGRPGAWDSPQGRTAGTLLIEIVESIGQIAISEIVEDVYRLTHLNWNAPDIEISLPVTIRWNDDALRETFRSPAEDAEEEDLEDDESDQLDDLEEEE